VPFVGEYGAHDGKPVAERAEYYETLSESPLLFPPADPLDANLHEYHAYDAETFRAWAELFGDVVNA
jgi:hypothetical protein